MEAAAASTEIWVLGWSAVLLIVQVVAAGDRRFGDLGADLSVQPARRGARVQAASSPAGSDRALEQSARNLSGLHRARRSRWSSPARPAASPRPAPVCWLGSRVIYVVIYAAGVPVVRTRGLAGVDRRARPDADPPDDLTHGVRAGGKLRSLIAVCDGALACRRRACAMPPARSNSPPMPTRAASPNSNSLPRKRRRDGQQQLSAAAGQRRRARRHRAVDGPGAASMGHADAQMPRWRRDRRRNSPPARVWEGVIYAPRRQGRHCASAGSRGTAAPEMLLLPALGPSLRVSAAYGANGFSKTPWDVFALKGCQE